MSNQFTKVYREEDELLRDCSYNVASIYFHLKNKRDFFKDKNNGTCYDCTRCISEYMGIPEITVKRAIATLKKIGLISTSRQGTGMKRKNIYSFPILDKIEGNTDKQEMKQIPENKPQEITNEIDDNMGNETTIVYNKETGKYEDTNPESSITEQTMESAKEFMTDEEKYGKNVVNFFTGDDDRCKILFNALRAYTDYRIFKETDKELAGTTANEKIRELALKFGLKKGTTDWINLVQYSRDFINEYTENRMNKLTEVA